MSGNNISNIVSPSSSSSTSTLLFSNISDNDDFKKRQNNLFKILLETEKETIKKDSFLSVSSKQNMTEKITFHQNIRKQNKHNKNKIRHSEQNIVFKKPFAVIPKCLGRNSKPDFKVNPHKWTKYSLGDVSDHDLSEKSNTCAALSFLNELKKQKDQFSEHNMEVDQGGSVRKVDKILFNKKRENKVTNEDTVVDAYKDTNNKEQNFIGTKHLMPEYVIGDNTNKVKKQRSGETKNVLKNGGKGKEIFLTHLFEDEGEETEE